MQRHRDILNLATHPDVVNGTVHQMISYLENNPLKNCVLFIDAEKVKFAQREVQHEVNFLRLLQSAERNVGKISKCACSLGNFVLSQCQCHSLYLGKKRPRRYRVTRKISLRSNNVSGTSLSNNCIEILRRGQCL